ncbi:uncharacterized protein PADG_07178 [Paracoccidioides brasiliensis Pb18]|uniref:Uncharacterized protein n=2 Tax=Paracoccidioides brasiliensis TaxID=121759 RepID=C1GIU2_PARBD|nr:uncharacterized protein PADG_07178 [Paracoccidioides brasiliensis Pb18]EEH42358.2 hypothetical protein PADG_07178 [Paracoccidioides brasiliensis Pb18]ODH36494.1 hypothetical protein ACO22_02777 [Paracoccidioides brasiliensis]ODH47088.1 hypothetical protein GX48_06801 [Paracoccidioides brasiliensis]
MSGLDFLSLSKTRFQGQQGFQPGRHKSHNNHHHSHTYPQPQPTSNTDTRPVPERFAHSASASGLRPASNLHPTTAIRQSPQPPRQDLPRKISPT